MNKKRRKAIAAIQTVMVEMMDKLEALDNEERKASDNLLIVNQEDRAAELESNADYITEAKGLIEQANDALYGATGE